MAFMESPALFRFKELKEKYAAAFGRRVFSYEFPFVVNMGGANLRQEIVIRPPMSSPFLALEVSISLWKTGAGALELPKIEFQDLAGSVLQSNPNDSALTCGPGVQQSGRPLAEPKFCEILVPGDGVLKVILTYPSGTTARVIKGTVAGLLFRGA